MITNRDVGPPEFRENLTADEVVELTKRNLDDPSVVSFEVIPNRHDRRRQAAMAHRKPKPQQRKKRNR